MLVEYLMSLADKIISGHIIGFGALSAITLVEPFTLLVAFAACVLADITGAPVTEAIGKGDQKKAEQYVSQSLIMAAAAGLLFTIIYVLFTDQLVNMVAGTSGQAEAVRDYFFWLRFLPLLMIMNGVLYTVVLYRGGENYCNLSAVFSVVSNIGLSVVLCYLDGLRGIGLGTVIGSFLGLIPLIMFMLSPKGKMKLSFCFSFNDIKQNLIYSVGGSLQYLYMAVFQMFMNMFLVWKFDDTSLVIFTGVINVVGLIAALSDGIVEFLIPMLNTYRGEQNELGRKSVMNISLKASIIESLVLTVILLVFAGMFASVFGVEDPDMVSGFAAAVRIYILSACFFYVTDLYSKYYLYIGKYALSLMIGFLQSLLFPLAFGVGAGMAFGLTGVWVGMSVSQAVLLAVCYAVIRSRGHAGRDLLFLDQEKMKKQHMWNIKMDPEEIMHMIDEIRNILKAENVPEKQINRASLVIEESQMRDLSLNKDPEKVMIECSLLEGEDITLILRNTGVCNNILDEKNEETLSGRLISRMPGVSNSYILANGNNRLIFHISR